MELFEALCPNCGAIYRVDSKDNPSRCEFCGAELSIRKVEIPDAPRAPERSPDEPITLPMLEEAIRDKMTEIHPDNVAKEVEVVIKQGKAKTSMGVFEKMIALWRLKPLRSLAITILTGVVFMLCMWQLCFYK